MGLKRRRRTCSDGPILQIRRAETLADLFATLDLDALPGFH